MAHGGQFRQMSKTGYFIYRHGGALRDGLGDERFYVPVDLTRLQLSEAKQTLANGNGRRNALPPA